MKSTKNVKGDNSPEVKVQIQPRVLDRVLMIENSFNPRNGEFISKLFQVMRGSKIELRIVDEELGVSSAFEFQPEVFIIDVDSLRHLGALTMAKELEKTFPEAPIIFLSERVNPVHVKEGMVSAFWTRAYWLNQPSKRPEMVLPEITRAFNRQKPLNPEVLEAAHREATQIGLLSPQQHRVLQAMSQGDSNAKIARECNLTLKAVERTIAAASRLLGVLPTSADVNPRVAAALLYRRSMLFNEPLE